MFIYLATRRKQVVRIHWRVPCYVNLLLRVFSTKTFLLPSKNSVEQIASTFKLSFLRLGSAQQNETRKKSTKQTHHSIIHQIPQKFHNEPDILVHVFLGSRLMKRLFVVMPIGGRKQIHLTVTTLDVKSPTIPTIFFGMFDSISRAAIFPLSVETPNVCSGAVKCWYWAQTLFFLQLKKANEAETKRKNRKTSTNLFRGVEVARALKVKRERFVGGSDVTVGLEIIGNIKLPLLPLEKKSTLSGGSRSSDLKVARVRFRKNNWQISGDGKDCD